MDELSFENDFFVKCLYKAANLINKELVDANFDIFSLGELIYKLEMEKKEKNHQSDLLIDYNDEIISIESVGEKETIDISVSGDNLFFCNDILIQNSFGLPATCDFMIALTRSEELDQLGQMAIKQLKNRYGDLDYYRRFVVGVNRAKMKLFDVDLSEQTLVDSGKKDDDTPGFDKSRFGEGMKAEKKNPFKLFKFDEDKH